MSQNVTSATKIDREKWDIGTFVRVRPGFTQTSGFNGKADAVLNQTNPNSAQQRVNHIIRWIDGAREGQRLRREHLPEVGCEQVEITEVHDAVEVEIAVLDAASDASEVGREDVEVGEIDAIVVVGVSRQRDVDGHVRERPGGHRVAGGVENLVGFDGDNVMSVIRVVP